MVVIDNLGHCVFVLNKEGNGLRQIGKEGTGPRQFKYPTAVSFSNENEIIVADTLNRRIRLINIQSGTVVNVFGQIGTPANGINFQAYLLDGLMRWNADRASAAVSSTESGPERYRGLLIHTVNELSEDVLGKKIKSNGQNIGIHTDVNLQLDSDTTSASDEDSAEPVGDYQGTQECVMNNGMHDMADSAARYKPSNTRRQFDSKWADSWSSSLERQKKKK
ncbi:Tripartite motif-containing protein 2 [Stylophora pistillata]|uniref:Tripartite motif-containing protein 2 n=1 Tax=Stylophora pistillata TaxID=50429 RepID=A0A2B4S2L6_STYPI|nr:Tripartite motif-containing protein 2 [Stylophora pistillata]